MHGWTKREEENQEIVPRDEEEKEMLAKEHQSKRRHEFAVFAPARPPVVNLVAQSLKNLIETNDDGEGLVRVALQKQKVIAPNVLASKKAKKAQPATEPRASILPWAIPRRVKSRATKTNPKISDKEWAVSFTGNKEDPTSSSSNSEFTDDTPLMPLRKSAPIPQLHPPPLSITPW